MHRLVRHLHERRARIGVRIDGNGRDAHAARGLDDARSEEHTSELQSLMRISYAVFCLKKKNETEMTAQNSTKPKQINHSNDTAMKVKQTSKDNTHSPPD